MQLLRTPGEGKSILNGTVGKVKRVGYIILWGERQDYY